MLQLNLEKKIETPPAQKLWLATSKRAPRRLAYRVLMLSGAPSLLRRGCPFVQFISWPDLERVVLALGVVRLCLSSTPWRQQANMRQNSGICMQNLVLYCTPVGAVDVKVLRYRPARHLPRNGWTYNASPLPMSDGVAPCRARGATCAVGQGCG